MRRLIGFTFALLLLLGLAGCERAKTKFDREVDRLCAIDGGVHIYEKVILPKENFDGNGRLTRKFQNDIGTKFRKGEVYWIDYGSSEVAHKEQSLIKTRMSITRHYDYLRRYSDGKILGENIWYSNGGGYIYFWPRDGSLAHRCPGLPEDFLSKIFVTGE